VQSQNLVHGMINRDQIKVTPRKQEVLNLLVQGCCNKEIASQLNISQRTVKQHMHILFLRAGIRGGGKRVKLARYARKDESVVVTPCKGLTPIEIQISIGVWEGLTNREIGKIAGTSEQGIKTHLHSAFDKLGVWTRLELAMHVDAHGGKDWLTGTQRSGSLGNARTICTETDMIPRAAGPKPRWQG
jgi:DNA-binding NarL/FixJ family response regulator